MFKLLVTLGCLIGYSASYPSGAPANTCTSLTPGHGNTTSIQNNNEYTINATPRAGRFVDVELLSPTGLEFAGYIMRADGVNGTFTIPDAQQEIDNQVICNNAAVTHTTNAAATYVEVQWLAPEGSTGDSINFIATVVQSYDIIYKNVLSTGVVILA